ncbi:MAG: STAS domain-containing protein [Desulfonatronovibrionaceae bacterium]
MAEVEVKKTPEGAEIVLQGDLNIECSADLHKVIQQTLTDNEVLKIDMQGVTNVDLSFLQIVCALFKEAVLEGKRLVFDPLPEKIVNKAEKMGFTEEYTGGYFWKGVADG